MQTKNVLASCSLRLDCHPSVTKMLMRRFGYGFSTYQQTLGSTASQPWFVSSSACRTMPPLLRDYQQKQQYSVFRTSLVTPFLETTPLQKKQKNSPPKSMTQTRRSEGNSKKKRSNSRDKTSKVNSNIERKDKEDKKEGFESLGLSHHLVYCAEEGFGFSSPTEVQQKVIPFAVKNLNVIASAETGTGKSAAYVFPILHQLMHKKRIKFEVLDKEEKGAQSKFDTELKYPSVLILAPTKELAEQIASYIEESAFYVEKYENDFARKKSSKVESLVSLLKETVTPSNTSNGQHSPKDVQVLNNKMNNTRKSKKKPKVIRVVTLIGRVSRQKQEENLRGGAHFIVATTGRLLEILQNQESSGEEILNLSKIRHFVLDECDRMLSMGFAADIMEIYKHLPRRNKSPMQVLLFSATVLPEIEGIMRRIAPHHILVHLNQNMKIPDTVKHVQYRVSTARKKIQLLKYLLKRKSGLKGKQALIFARTKQRVDRICERLNSYGYKAHSIHKGQPASVRSKSIKLFKQRDIQLLISTDVLARGIDVEDLEYVINFDVPAKPEEYVHRIGRTGRAGKEGMAISFVSETPLMIPLFSHKKNLVELNELDFVKTIERFIGSNIELRKIPGPWKDEIDPNEKEEILQTSREQAFSILEKKKEEEQKRKEYLSSRNIKLNGTFVERFSESYRNLKQKAIERGAKSIAELENAPTLRNFKEGRYEDVITKFNEKSAEKKGIDVEKIKKETKKMLRKKKKQKSSDTSSMVSFSTKKMKITTNEKKQ